MAREAPDGRRVRPPAGAGVGSGRSIRPARAAGAGRSRLSGRAGCANPGAAGIASPSSAGRADLLLAGEREQTLMVLAAGGAPLEVGADARKLCVGVGSRKFELHVLIEQLEAPIARHLESGRTERALQSLVVLVI